MLATLMALQAGLPPLDFSPIQGKKRNRYFTAVRAGLERNYKPMEEIFRWVRGAPRQSGRFPACDKGTLIVHCSTSSNGINSSR